jgi:protease I
MTKLIRENWQPSSAERTARPLEGVRIALLVAPLYEDIEVHYPKLRLEEEGAEIVCVGVDESIYRDVFWSLALGARGRMTVPGYDGRVYTGVHGMPVGADVVAESVASEDFGAVVIPGGYAADHLRRSDAVLGLCRRVAEAGRPVAAICHGPWVLATAGLVQGRQVTGHWVLRGDLEGAGGLWVDQPCVVDGPIITSRFPNDLGPFCQAITSAIVATRIHPR